MCLFSCAKRMKDVLLSAHRLLWAHCLHVSKTFNAEKALNDIITAEHRWAERVYNEWDIFAEFIIISYLFLGW